MEKNLLLLLLVASTLSADESSRDQAILAAHISAHTNGPVDSPVDAVNDAAKTDCESLLAQLARACGKEGSSLDIYSLPSAVAAKVLVHIEDFLEHYRYCVENDPFYHINSCS